MDTTASESLILQRSLDLCEAIAGQPDFLSLKAKLDAFMGDELLKFQYQQLNDLGNLLQMKQGNGVELKPEEVGQFEALREQLLGSPVVVAFLEAQEELRKLHQSVSRALDKTFELGRRPDLSDLHDGSCCGGGCH